MRASRGWALNAKSPGSGAFLMQRIIRIMLVPALKAHGFLAQIACLNVSIAKLSRALRALLPSFTRISCSCTFHGSDPISAAKQYFIEKFLSIHEIAICGLPMLELFNQLGWREYRLSMPKEN